MIRPNQHRLGSPRRDDVVHSSCDLGRLHIPKAMGVHSDQGSGHNIECDGRSTKGSGQA